LPNESAYFQARRIGLCGSQRPPTPTFLAFCNEVGQALAQSSGTIIAIAGRRISNDEEGHAADLEFADGFRSALTSRDALERIETFRFKNEARPQDYFQVGRVVEVQGKSREARRFAMVHAVDALVGVGGTDGTAQQLTFALATEKPALPVPCFGGSARSIWHDHREALLERLRLAPDEAATWERTPTGDGEARQLARRMVEVFLASLAQRCFVIMPFAADFSPLIDFVIDPVVRGLGDEPVHLGRREQPGDVGRQISEGLARADYVVCVLDGMRPNVLYELGMAHALGKPAVLMWKRLADGALQAPFDIVQEQRIEYDSIDASLRPRLERAVRHIKRQPHSR